MPKTSLTFVTFVAAAFMVGLCVGTLVFRSILHGVSFADMTLVLLTYLGLCFAAHAYYRWLDDKKREDSYSSAKRYLGAIDEAQVYLHNLQEHYNLMCPARGVVTESSQTSARRLNQISTLRDRLHQSTISLIRYQRELKFWRVSLTPSFKKNHEDIVTNLRSLGVIASTLENQLYHFTIGEGQNMDVIIREKRMLDEKIDAFRSSVDQRIESGFEGVFDFAE